MKTIVLMILIVALTIPVNGSWFSGDVEQPIKSNWTQIDYNAVTTTYVVEIPEGYLYLTINKNTMWAGQSSAMVFVPKSSQYGIQR